MPTETSARKVRKCPRCRAELPFEKFIQTKSPFFPGSRSIICTDCLERMVPQDDLAAVDRLLRWLDLPLELSAWTRLYEVNGDHTLSAYANLLRDSKYESIDWSQYNAKWKEAIANRTIEKQIPALQDKWRETMRKKWPGKRTDDDYLYLEELYNGVLNTQNVSTAIQKDEARRLCEVALIATQKIRDGEDAKNEMSIYHSIIKENGFVAKNSKSNADFDSVGEIVAYLEERGWQPTFAHPKKDDVDVTMDNIQQYLSRLVMGEGGIREQVDKRREAMEIARQLEEESTSANGYILSDNLTTDETQLDYEDEDALFGEMGGE